MKRVLILIILCIPFSSVIAQIDSIETLMTRRYISCQDIRYNTQFLIPEYYNRGSRDTLKAILNYWKRNCGVSEETTRCEILLAIDNNTFTDSTFNLNIIDYLLSYRNEVGWDSRTPPGSFFFYRYTPPYKGRSDTLRNFTVSLAKELSKREDLTPTERFFARWYSNDFENTFAMLQSPEFDGTRIQRLYYNKVNQYKIETVFHGDWLAGVWVPQDNLSLVGTHPYLGLRLGVRHKRWIADFSFGFKFASTGSVIEVYEEDSLYQSNYFFGGYVGLDADFEMLRVKKNSLHLIGGVALDGFDVLKIDMPDSEDNISKTLNSLNLNVGLGYKYHLHKWNYLGLDVKYNFVDFKNTLGTDLGGNAITINLMYGFSGGRFERYQLERLDYYE